MLTEPIEILREDAARLAAGAVDLLPNIVTAVVVLLLTWLAAALMQRTALRLIGRNRRPSLRLAAASLVRISVWTLGLLITAMVLFPNLTPTKLLAGLGLGTIAVGLAFQDTFENFLAGILILLREPMRIGDDIECEGISGRVEEITIRDSYIRKRSGELVLVPNSFLFKNPLMVLTDRAERRVTLEVGVAYGEDVDAARTVIQGAVERCASPIGARPVEVFASAFGASSVDYHVRWWVSAPPPDELRSRDEVVAAIKRALDEAGIEIPFPYRTLTFKEPLRLHAPETAAG